MKTAITCPKCRAKAVQTVPSIGGKIQYHLCLYCRYKWATVKEG